MPTSLTQHSCAQEVTCPMSEADIPCCRAHAWVVKSSCAWFVSYLQAVVGHVDISMHIGHWVLEVWAVYGCFPQLCTALYHWLALLPGNPAHPHSKLSLIDTLLQHRTEALSLYSQLCSTPCSGTYLWGTEAALQLGQGFAFASL